MRNLKRNTGSGSEEKPHLEVYEYEADANGNFAIDDDGDCKKGFYWRIMGGSTTAATEIGPYGDFDAAAEAGRQAYAKGAY